MKKTVLALVAILSSAAVFAGNNRAPIAALQNVQSRQAPTYSVSKVGYTQLPSQAYVPSQASSQVSY